MVLFGCSSAGTPCAATFTCEEKKADVHLLEGEATLAVGDAGTSVLSISEDAGDCTPLIVAIPGNVASVGVQCQVPEAARVSIEVPLPDIASMTTLGTSTISGDSVFRVFRTASGPECLGSYPQYEFSVTLEEAEGGLGSPLVTPDYARTLRVDVPVRSVFFSLPWDTCPGITHVTGGFSIRLRQSAGDVHFRADAACPCPG
jgi:hypothetical protein